MRTEKEYFQGHDVAQEHKKEWPKIPEGFFFWGGVDATGSLMQDFQQWPRPTLIPIRHLGGCWVWNGDTKLFIIGRKPFLPPPPFSIVLTLDAVLVMRSPNTIQRHIHPTNLLLNALFPKHQGCSDFLYGSLCLRQASALLVQLQVWLTRRTWTCHWMLMWGFPELPGKRHRSPFAPGTATAANAVHIAINLGSSVLVGPNNVTWTATLRICRDMAEYKIILWMLLGFRDWTFNLEIAIVIWMQSSAYLWRCLKLLCHVLPNIWCKKLVQIWWESVTTPCFYWPIAWTSSWSSQGADRPRE